MVPKRSTRNAKNAAISEATPQPDSPSLEQSSELTDAIHSQQVEQGRNIRMPKRKEKEKRHVLARLWNQLMQ